MCTLQCKYKLSEFLEVKLGNIPDVNSLIRHVLHHLLTWLMFVVQACCKAQHTETSCKISMWRSYPSPTCLSFGKLTHAVLTHALLHWLIQASLRVHALIAGVLDVCRLQLQNPVRGTPQQATLGPEHLPAGCP